MIGSAIPRNPLIPNLRALAAAHWKALGLPHSRKIQWKSENPEMYRRGYSEYNRRPEVRARAARRNRSDAEIKRAWLLEQKTSSPCLDCGQFFPGCCMDYDHLPGNEKIENLARMIGRSQYKIEDMQKEISKCELVCANCHRIRTFLRRSDQAAASPRDSDIVDV